MRISAAGSYNGSEGQKSIDPVAFFKLMLFGYLENLNGARKIIKHGRFSVKSVKPRQRNNSAQAARRA